LEATEVETDAAADAATGKRIAGTRDNVTRGKADGGNVHEFRRAVRDRVNGFIADDRRAIWVFNPAAFDVTRQDTNAYNDEAAMANLTVVEVTRVLAEELLDALSGELSAEARVLLVLEEAHSLVPEWNSTSNEADKQASTGIAKAVLQGRKFGMGILVITQRTANVSKTVLNQSNTVFALRSFDATGMEFLSNYMGSDYSQLLPTLEERTAVVFGRASSCAAPLIVKLNDYNAFATWLSTQQADEADEAESHIDVEA
jgi:DNA helicase HerA-like ATPase